MDKLIEEETGGEEVLEDRLPLLGVPLSVKHSYALQGKNFKNLALHFDYTQLLFSGDIVTSNTSCWPHD